MMLQCFRSIYQEYINYNHKIMLSREFSLNSVWCEQHVFRLWYLLSGICFCKHIFKVSEFANTENTCTLVTGNPRDIQQPELYGENDLMCFAVHVNDMVGPF